jgi:hypothetical protein
MLNNADSSERRDVARVMGVKCGSPTVSKIMRTLAGNRGSFLILQMIVSEYSPSSKCAECMNIQPFLTTSLNERVPS